MSDYARARIEKLRTMLLAFRYLYYCRDESIINDFEYDARELELKQLVAEHPALDAACDYSAECPSRTVGTSIAEGYPLPVQELAERLLATHEQRKDYFEPEDLSPENNVEPDIEPGERTLFG